MKTKTITSFAFEVKGQLPQILQSVVNHSASPAEADMMLMGAITTLSATLPNIYGIYDQNTIFPNLYLFVNAKASAGKGRLNMCKGLIKPIVQEQQALSDVQSLLLPANSSATAIYQQLALNNGHGLIFETEADTLDIAMRNSFGNFSDGLRKAFHHESISYLRRKENERIEILEPHLSVVLSGTPKQCHKLIPNAENGLFSRFAIMYLESNNSWSDVFCPKYESNSLAYSLLANRIYELYKRLRCVEKPIEFKFTGKQKTLFNQYFNGIQESLINDDNFTPSIRRMGVITYRIAMILSALHLENCKCLPSTINCTNKTFDAALAIAKSLLQHAMQFYSSLPEGEEASKQYTQKEKQKENLLQMMPNEFSRKELVNVGKTLNISIRTADTYLREFIASQRVENIAYGLFRKVEIQNQSA